jgi:hypothetical protein
MRQLTTALLVAACLLARAGTVSCHSEESAIALRTYTGITVDGTLEDWVRRLESGNWSGQLEVKKGRVIEWMRAAPIYVNTLTAKVESGAIGAPEDFSAVIYTLWDDKRLYVAATVVDDQVVTQHEAGDIWQDDAVELWIDCRHDAVTHTLFQEDEFQIGFSPASQHRNHAVAWAWRNPLADTLAKQLEVASVLTSNGYVIEASMPWTALTGCQPGFGGMMGFNVSVVDKDQDQLWTHITWSGQLHSDPSQFGHLYFLDAPIDLFPSDVFESSSGVSPWDTTGDRESAPPGPTP